MNINSKISVTSVKLKKCDFYPYVLIDLTEIPIHTWFSQNELRSA